MSAVSPLIDQHRAYARGLAGTPAGAQAAAAVRPGAAVGQRGAAEVEFIPWGVPAESQHRAGPSAAEAPQEFDRGAGDGVCEIIATFGEVEAEYAAIRRGAGLLDAPHRGTLIVAGSERRAFLNRMITQELKDLAADQTREGFWLNRRGRIDADLFLIETGERMLLDLDLANAAAAAKTLGEFVFTEEVEIRDASNEFHQVQVHGRLARETVAAAASLDSFDLAAGAAGRISIDGVETIVARRDDAGEPGFALIMPRDGAPRAWEFLVAADHIVGGDRRRVRPIGWHAYNIARIEAGTPLFNIDFGPTNLPHETGVLQRRVSFTKGCYLGQEVVARMHSRGHSKQSLVGLRIDGDALPVAGSQVFAVDANGAMGEQTGVVTSSTLSPMLGAAAIAFALVRPAQAAPGSKVLVNAEGAQAHAVVGPLRLWGGGADAAAAPGSGA